MSRLDLEGMEPALARLRSARGKAYWQGLDELIDRPDFRRRVAERFPALARLAPDLKRRDFMKCLAGALALAGLDGCEREPDENAYPYVRAPEGVKPGDTRYYATAVEYDGIGQPVIGKCRDGRPIKLEGNPDHPASGGSTDAFTQAALLGLYDPERSGAPQKGEDVGTWADFQAMARQAALRLDERRGHGFRLLTGPVGSPTLLRQIAVMRSRWPEMRWHVHAPLMGHFDEATRNAFGRALERRLRLDRAQAIVAIEDDPLGPGPCQTWHARGWSARRMAYQQGEGNALLYVAEASPTLTGVAATDRLVSGAWQAGALLAALAAKLKIGGFPVPPLEARARAWVSEAAVALARHKGSGLLIVGQHQPPEMQQLALAINAALGNLGHTLELVEPAVPADAHGTLPDLLDDIGAGRVETLAILGSNPAYSAPQGMAVGQALAEVPHRIHAGLHRDETAVLCHWHLPLAHDLESWGDARGADGSACLIQPLVRPFLDVRSRPAVLAMLAGQESRARDIVRETWLAHWQGDEDRWRDSLMEGRIAQSAPEPVSVSQPRLPLRLPLFPEAAKPTIRHAREEEDATASFIPRPEQPHSARRLDLVFRADPCVHDGSFAGNPWLQELPKPLTKLTWDNAIHVSPALAAELGLENGEIVELAAGPRRVRGPVWILPGQERSTLLIHLGYGRRAGGAIAEGVGFDANALRGPEAPWRLRDVTLTRTGGHHPLASTQTHTAMDGEDFVRFVESAGEGLARKPAPENFYPPQEKRGPAWGMSIDLDLCIGCNACAVACVAENNVPMVGKEQVAKGREMHWLRVDRYYEGDPQDPDHVFQPVPCMHCEDAPCEMGCPVNATVHSPDGLNLQVYNRCIGTRTCSAYCPYKVRRFNWLDYTRDASPEVKAVRNPEVSVRDRGVMEKCTYCIQRIEEARIEAGVQGRPIAEGEVRTACQQACPTQAIVFGDVARADSAVSRRKADGRDYALLEEANTRPRTTYSARIARGEKRA